MNDVLEKVQRGESGKYHSRLESLVHHAFDVMGLRRHLKEVTFMADFCSSITESLLCRDVLASAAQKFYEAAPFRMVAFYHLPEGNDQTILFSSVNEVNPDEGESAFLQALPGLKPENMHDYLALGLECPGEREAACETWVLDLPLDGGRIAFLSAIDIRSQFSDKVLEKMLESFALAWQNAVKFEKVKEESMRDSLTGLYNRRVLDEMLEIEDRKRGVNPLSLLIIDLDNFKSINDNFGHPVGDMALMSVAAVLRDSARGSDLVVRNGGEEFAVMLPAASASVAFQVGERLRKGIERALVECNGVRVPLSASIGIAHRPSRNLFPAKNLIAQADEALYQAKRTGKNRICFFSSSPVIVSRENEKGQPSSDCPLSCNL